MRYDEVWVKNIFPDGQFKGGTSGWGYGAATMSIVDGNFRFVGDGSSNDPNVSKALPISNLKAGQKFYVRFYAKLYDTAINISANINVSGFGENYSYLYSPPVGEWTKFSAIITNQYNTANETVRLYIYQRYSSAEDANGKIMDIDRSRGIVAINMGADSSHPLYDKTAEEMDALFPDYFLMQEINPFGRDVWVKNLVPNGNFKDGVGNWKIGGGVLSVENGWLKAYHSLTISPSTVVFQDLSMSIPAQTKLFARIKMKVTHTNSSHIQLYLAGTDEEGTITGLTFEKNSSTLEAGKEYVLYGIIRAPKEFAKISYRAQQVFDSGDIALGSSLYIKDCVMINMGTDPTHPLYSLTADQMAALTEEYFELREINPYSKKTWVRNLFRGNSVLNAWTVDLNRGTKQLLADGTLRFTGNGTGRNMTPFNSTSYRINVKAGQKVYFKIKARFSDITNATNLRVSIFGLSPAVNLYNKTPTDIEENEWVTFGSVIEINEDASLGYAITITYPDEETQNGKHIDIRDCMIIDMGQEPSHPLYSLTAEQMAVLTEEYFNLRESNIPIL